MKRLTLFAVAACAAMVMTTALGAASASAGTVLCSEAESVCATANVLPAGANIALAKDPYERYFDLYLGNGSTVECDYAAINSVSTKQAGNPLAGHSEVLVYPENCRINWEKQPTENCQTFEINSPAETLEATGGGTGVIKLGSKAEPLTISLSCYNPHSGKVVTCGLKATSSFSMKFEGYGAKAAATMEQVPGACGGVSILSFELGKNLSNGFISTHTSTAICSKEESVCANENVLGTGSHVALGKGLEGKFRISIGSGPQIGCDYAAVNSVSTAEFGSPLSAQSEVGVYPENCRFEYKGAENCQSLTVNSPKETIEGSGGGSGTIYLGSKAEPFTVSFACKNVFYSSKTPLSCSYQAESSIPIHYTTNGWIATINSSESHMIRVSGPSPCTALGALEAELGRGGGGFFSTV